MATKYVYRFGPQGTDGDAKMKNLLGGKGANLAEMARLELPVPAGFTISTEFCTAFFKEGGKFPQSLRDEVAAALAQTEQAMAMKYGDAENPLLLSCRSGARSSMPGMMETVLNVGLCPATIPGLVKKSGNERFVYDAYRRLIMMYSDVVMEKAEDIEPAEGKGIRVQLEQIMAQVKKSKKYTADTDLTAKDLKKLCEDFKKKVQEVLGQRLPRRSAGAALGGRRRRVQELERPPRHLLPQDRGHSPGMGHRLQRAEHGLRQPGRHLGHRRGLHPQPGHRREQVLRRMAGQRPGRGRGRRHPHAQSAQRRDQERAEQASSLAADGHARSCTSSFATSARSSNSTTRTCRTSSSRSRRASSTCSSAATASGPARRP